MADDPKTDPPVEAEAEPPKEETPPSPQYLTREELISILDERDSRPKEEVKVEEVEEVVPETPPPPPPKDESESGPPKAKDKRRKGFWSDFD